MNAITLIWRQVLKELKLFQMKENKEDAVEKTDKEPQKTLKCHEDKYTVPLPDTAPPTGREKETERKQPVRLTQEVRTFLQKQYDFRYNLLTEETEYRPANKRAVPFEPVSKRELNTFCMEAHDQGISCWDKDLSRYIYSTCIPKYHPFRLYMEELPGWDGTDVRAGGDHHMGYNIGTAVVKVDFSAVASGQLYDPLGLANAAAPHRLGLVDVCRTQIHHLLK